MITFHHQCLPVPKKNPPKYVFVVGNGESRIGVDVDALKIYGDVWGCNAIYRDFTPTYLVAVDPKMIDEICKTGYPKHHPFYSREPNKCKDARKIPQIAFDRRYASGPLALWLSLQNIDEDRTFVFLLGFDFFNTNGGMVNNVYKSTTCYTGEHQKHNMSQSQREAVHVGDIMNEYPNVHFYKVGDTKDAVPKQIKKSENCTYISYDSLWAKLNTPPLSTPRNVQAAVKAPANSTVVTVTKEPRFKLWLLTHKEHTVVVSARTEQAARALARKTNNKGRWKCEQLKPPQKEKVIVSAKPATLAELKA